jgi:hypothetical protein
MLPLHKLVSTTSIQHYNISYIKITRERETEKVFCSSLSRPVNILNMLIQCTKTTINRCNVLIRIQQTWRGDDLLKLDDVRVVQLLKDFNLTDIQG